MSAQEIKELVERLNRSAWSTTESPEDGLALAICSAIDALHAGREKALAELETERMRLAACGVIALSNTRESAAKQRQMKPGFWSASAEYVARAVDREMDHREAQQRDAEYAAMYRWLREHYAPGIHLDVDRAFNECDSVALDTAIRAAMRANP